MRLQFLIGAIALVTLGPAFAQADPELFVTYEGVNLSGNNEFLVAIAPDESLFGEVGGSMAVELAFAVTGSTIASIDVNTLDWEVATPGHNPFTDTVTDGTWIGDDSVNAFTSYGSRIFTTGDPVELFTMETLGPDLTTVDYGVAASGDEVEGATIAQAGSIFNPESTLIELMTLAAASGAGGGSGGAGDDPLFFHGYTGSVASIPEPAGILLAALAMVAGTYGAYRRNR